MYSIPQNFLLFSENVIKNCLKEEINILIGSLLNKFLFSFNYKYIEFDLLSKLKESVINALKKAIKIIDKKFLNSIERKENLYVNKCIERTFVSLYGELTYERFYYTDKNKKNGFFFIDELLKFEKYKTYTASFRALIINSAIITNANIVSFNTSLFTFNINDYIQNNYKNIPRQTIYKWIKEFKTPKIKYKTIENVNSLYVMVDEKWIHEQIRLSSLDDDEKKKHHYIMSKCFITFTGSKKKNNRTKLLNKHHFLTSSTTPWQDFMNEIYNIYNFEEINKIHLISDAGSWILAGKNELRLFPNNKVEINTCEFHVKQKIARSTTDKDLRLKIADLIYEKEDKNAFIREMDKIIDSKDKQSRKDKITEYKNYILKHWKHIINMKYSSIKSSMEAHISHCVASQFGSRPKAYSKNNIEKYLKLQEYKLNGINIIDLYLNSLNKNDDFIYNEKEINYSIFNKSTSPIISNSLASVLSH